jgi:hypothetical protein
MGITASNNPLPCDPNNKQIDKLDRGGYEGNAQDLKNEIDAIAIPDKITKVGVVTVSGNQISIPALAFEGYINSKIHKNIYDFQATIDLANVGMKRIDIFVLTEYDAIVRIAGPETEDTLVKILAPVGTLEVAYIVVNELTVTDPVMPDPGVDVIKRQPYTTFKPIQKGYGNTNLEIDEIGDIFCGWSNDGTIRITEGKWLGGSLADSNNFRPLVQVGID